MFTFLYNLENSYFTSNGNLSSFLYQVVNLKEARDFSTKKGFIYVFKVMLNFLEMYYF